ncbi:MAG: transporter small permease [Rhodospirillales bacterium]|nr:transporter small permease [Rhodospirillales bacterium]
MIRRNPIARYVEGAARWVALVGGWWLLALSLLTCIEILLRKFAGVSLQGVDEIGGYTLAIFSSLCFAWALVGKSHARVDFLLGRMSESARALLNASAYVLLAALADYTAWRGYTVFDDSLEFQARANSPLQTPLWIPQADWLAGLVVFALAAGACAVHAMWLLLGPPAAQRPVWPDDAG